MGAVFLLVLLPIIGSLGFMLKTIQNDPSSGGLLAAAMFVFLSIVLAVGIMRMARTWDEAEH
jgi:hypothetical protein